MFPLQLVNYEFSVRIIPLHVNNEAIFYSKIVKNKLLGPSFEGSFTVSIEDSF